MGDTVVLAPLIAALRFAGHDIGLVASRACGTIFRPDVVRSHIVEDPDQPHSVLADIRARHYEIALIATEKPYGYELAYQAGIAKRIGFWNGFAKPFKSVWVRKLCTEVQYRSVGIGRRHEVEMLFRLGSKLHDESTPTQDLVRLTDLFFRIVPERKDVLAVQITPKWDFYGNPDVVADLLLELAPRRALRLLASSREEAYVAEIERRTKLGVERHHQAATWIERVASAQMLLTPDTGAAHVAGMVGTKVIDCFPNNTTQAFRDRWRPWASPAIVYTMQTFSDQGAIASINEAWAKLVEQRGIS